MFLQGASKSEYIKVGDELFRDLLEKSKSMQSEVMRTLKETSGAVAATVISEVIVDQPLSRRQMAKLGKKLKKRFGNVSIKQDKNPSHYTLTATLPFDTCV